MRLAGIEGVVVCREEEVKKTLKDVSKNKEIAVVLITEKLVNLCSEFIYKVKLYKKQPLLIEIPDRHGGGRTKDSISSYVRDAIGLKI